MIIGFLSKYRLLESWVLPSVKSIQHENHLQYVDEILYEGWEILHDLKIIFEISYERDNKMADEENREVDIKVLRSGCQSRNYRLMRV